MSKILVANRIGRSNRFSEQDMGGGSGPSSPSPLDYAGKTLALTGNSLVGYWIQDEPSGSVSFDRSSHAFNGVYSNVTLGQPGIGDGRSAASYNGTSSFDNLFSAGLAAAFNGPAGTLALWARVSGAGIWTDGLTHRHFFIAVDAGNRVILEKTSANNTIIFTYTAGATAKSVSRGSTSPTDWFHMAITWDKAADQMIAYYQGIQTGATQTALGTWAGVPTSTQMTIGSQGTAAINVWNGLLAHGILCNTALPAATIAALATP